MNIVMLEYKIGDIITFDKHVFGVAIDDYLKYRKIKNIIHVNEKDMLSNTICKCKEILFDAVIGDNIKKDSTLYYEIKKIRSELNNIKIIQDDNYTRYAKIDKNIGMGRACCFIYYINIINQLASLTKE